MRYGIVSDVHANIQAWKAVLRDMNREGVDAILCLGDVVGYGPNPAEVLDSCYKYVDYFILGNHDAVIGNRLDSGLFNDNARFLIEWTRDQLNSSAADFFSEMPMQMEGDGFVCAHAELAIPGRFNYIYQAQDAIESFTSNNSPVMFVGHTHLPAKFTYDLTSNLVRSDICTDGYLQPHERYLINVGSVGDPRDGQTTASYCIYDADSGFLSYRQVPFDIKKFRSSLLKAKLPIQPYFLSVYDGISGENETIKDMKVMESNQAAEAPGKIQRIKSGSDTKTGRQKITFSLDDVRSTKQSRESKERQKKSDVKTKKKGTKIISVLLLILLLGFGGVIGWFKLQKKDSESPGPEVIVNKPSEKIKQELKEIVTVQIENEEMVLGLGAAKISSGLRIENDELLNWKSANDSLKWKVRISQKGWYQVIAEMNGTSEKAQVEVKLGPTAIAGNIENSSGRQTIALFENLNAGTMDFVLSLADEHGKEVTRLKSISLKYAGVDKPFNYSPDDLLLGDFESGTLQGWITSNTGFGDRAVSAEVLPSGVEIQGVRGKFLAASIAVNSQSTGKLRSPVFTVQNKWACMMVAGGPQCSVNLYVDGVLVQTEDFKQMTPLSKFYMNLKPYAGKSAYLEFVDGGESFIAVDNVVLISGEKDSYQPGPASTVKGIQKEVEENKLNKFLSKAGSKLLKKDFKGCLRDIEEAAVVTGTNMAEYSAAVNSISDLEKLVIESFRQDLNKTTGIFTRSLPGKKTSVLVKSVKGDKVNVIVEGTKSEVPLSFLNLSENGVMDRAATVPGGLIAYHIHKETLKESLNKIDYNPQSPLGILVDAATGGLKIKYPKDAVVGSLVEIWALEEESGAKWKLSVNSSDGDSVMDNPGVVDINEIYKDSKLPGSKAFKVYRYDLSIEKQLKSVSFADPKGELKSMLLLVKNTKGQIVWQKSYHENETAPKNLLLAKTPFEMTPGERHCPGENLALKKAYEASDMHSGGYSGLNDGIWAFSPPFLFGSSRVETFPKYVTVDLGEAKLFNLIRFGIPNRGSTKNISLQYSLDNNEYKTILDFHFGLGVTERYAAHFLPVNARYVRVRFNENYEKTLNRAPNGHVFISELEVYLLD